MGDSQTPVYHGGLVEKRERGGRRERREMIKTGGLGKKRKEGEKKKGAKEKQEV